MRADRRLPFAVTGPVDFSQYFRGRRGDRVELLWFDGDGLCLFAKLSERGRFVWPQAVRGRVTISTAQLAMLLEGIDWRHPERTWQPEIAA